MAIVSKSVPTKLDYRSRVKLPEVIIEELALTKDSKVVVTYGRNYSCVIITPVETKLGSIQKERINKLTCEPLETER